MGRFKVTDLKMNADYMNGISYDMRIYELIPGPNGARTLKETIESIGVSNASGDFNDFNIPVYVNYGRRNGKTQVIKMMTNGVFAAPNNGIKKVIFHDPATIVFWADGTKTVVKCQPGDTYNKEVGLSLCIAKRAMGNQSNFNNIFKKWCGNEE